MLFRNTWNPSSILIRIWEWCATNCYNCYSKYDNIKFYSYESFLAPIDFIGNKCDETFSIFLFWVEAIFHPDIERFISNPTLSKYRISLHINPTDSQKRRQQIYLLSQKYKHIFFETCFTLKSQEDFISIFKHILFLKNSDINSSMDLFLDFTKYGDLIKNLFAKYNFIYRKQPNTSHLNYTECLEFTANDKRLAIMIYHQKTQEIRNKRITNIPENGCVIRRSFEFEKGFIWVNEEIELCSNGVIKVHINTYCNKAIQSISHITKDDNSIYQDFLNMYHYLEDFDGWDMWKKCFECISNPYFSK